MKKIRVENDVQLRGVKKVSGKSILIDYYIEIPNEDSIYAFSKRYTNTTYDMCKSGVRLNKLICTKTRNQAVMQLVNYTRFLLPYLTEEYKIPVIM